MNELNWIQDIQWQDLSGPTNLNGDEEVFTLYMSDFLKMPDVDYNELVEIDPHVRALLN